MFAKHHSVIDKLRDGAAACKVEAITIDGRTNTDERSRLLQIARHTPPKVLIISYGVGSEGLDGLQVHFAKLIFVEVQHIPIQLHHLTPTRTTYSLTH